MVDFEFWKPIGATVYTGLDEDETNLKFDPLFKKTWTFFRFPVFCTTWLSNEQWIVFQGNSKSFPSHAGTSWAGTNFLAPTCNLPRSVSSGPLTSPLSVSLVGTRDFHHVNLATRSSVFGRQEDRCGYLFWQLRLHKWAIRSHPM